MIKIMSKKKKEKKEGKIKNHEEYKGAEKGWNGNAIFVHHLVENGEITGGTRELPSSLPICSFNIFLASPLHEKIWILYTPSLCEN